MTTVDTSRPNTDDPGPEPMLEAPECPECGHVAEGQSLLRAEMDGAFFRADFLCESCNHDHPVWYEN